MNITETIKTDHQKPPSPTEDEQSLPFEQAEFRERLIRGLPVADRLKSLLLAIDALCSESGIREGGTGDRRGDDRTNQGANGVAVLPKNPTL